MLRKRGRWAATMARVKRQGRLGPGYRQRRTVNNVDHLSENEVPCGMLPPERMPKKCAACEPFNEVVDCVFARITLQVGPQPEPSGEVISGVLTLSLNATGQIEDGHDADKV
jgi:hypothetical protein